MCKKLLLFTAAIVLLLGFAGQATADPNLVGLWQFDGDANDSSGNGNDGTLYGSYGSYVDGKIAQALNLDPNNDDDADPGNAYVAVPDDDALDFGEGSFAIAVWLKYATTGSGTIVTKGLDDFDRGYRYRWGGASTYIDIADGSGTRVLGASGTGAIDDGEWHHHVATRDFDSVLIIYYDGILKAAKFEHIGDINTLNDLVIGRDGADADDGYFDGLIDDLRLYNKFMTTGDTAKLMEPFAWAPSPEDGEQYILVNADLLWNPGMSSKRFDVYFGTDESDVNDANTTTTLGVYKSNQDANSFDPNDPTASDLLHETTYYWRIDSLDDANNVLNKGAVWTFDSLPTEAHDPDPPNNAEHVLLEKVLSWSVGYDANTHDVYFGTDESDVNDANTTNGLGVYKGNQSDPNFDPNDPTASDLLVNTTYYWRIDEVNSTTVKGDVWEFKTIISIDPNLRGHWTFDEGQGDKAYDASGHGNTGTLYGDPTWVASALEGALDFDGSSDYVKVDDDDSISFGTGSLSISFWMKTSQDPADKRILVNGTSGGGEETGKRYDIRYHNTKVYFTLDDNANKVELCGTTGYGTGEWTHVAAVRNKATGRTYLYRNAEMDRNMSDNSIDINSPGEPLLIGSGEEGEEHFLGSLDDVRLYDYALSQDEIDELASKAAFPPAWAPVPVDGATNVRQNTKLGWKKGVWAQSHDVYFGTSWDDVNDANTTVDPNDVYKENIFVTSWDPATDGNYSNGLDRAKLYYWRIDEVNVVTSKYNKGDVWSFTTANTIIVDDMELYGNSPDPCDVWKDSNGQFGTNGSAVFLQKGDFVHLGLQSMRYTYDNDGVTEIGEWYVYKPGCYSEIDANTTGPNSLDCGKDWTRNDSKALTLYFYGAPNNDVIGDANAMYVVIEDGDGNDANAMTKYGDYADEDVNDVNDESWHEWNIALDDFNTPNDVNLANIAKVYIGFGRRGEDKIIGSGRPGGQGTVYFDDIRLNQSRCIAIYNSDVDLNGDCDIDYDDIDVLQNDWLDVNTVAINPGTGNLVAHYEFEDDANDSVGGTPDQNGVEYGNPVYTTGKIDSNAISFDPTDANDCVVVEDVNATIAAEFSTGPFTIALWLKSSNDSVRERVLCNGTSGGTQWDLQNANDQQTGKRYELYFEEGDYFNFAIDDANASGKKSQITTGNSNFATGDWVHVATIRDTDAKQLILYCDGVKQTHIGTEWDGNDVSGDISSPNEPLVFGAEPVNVDNGVYSFTDFMTGELDDVRIYDKALTLNEVIYLASEGGPTPDDMKYDTDLNLDNFVNLKDYAVLADAWLDDYRWP